MVQLATFQAAFQGSVTPMTPDMVPLILDTGASISITPFKCDFITPIRPVQHVNIKGIAAGLTAAGVRDIAYSFINDAGETQQLLLRNCLYVPSCAMCLVCPRQIGSTTGNQTDGLLATHSTTTLFVHGHPTTVRYDPISQLPILFTKPGIDSYIQFCEYLHRLSAVPTPTSTPVAPSMTKRQRQKLYTLPAQNVCA
jgi:hypothetical protein